MIYKRFANMPGQVVYRDGSSASREDYEDFHRMIYKNGGSVWAWEVLLNYEPAIRLKIMLGRTAEMMVQRSVVTVVPEGLEPQELVLLASVEQLEPRLQVVAHELLCVRERQLFVDTFRTVFNAYKAKE